MKNIFLIFSIAMLTSCQAQDKQFSEEALSQKLVSLEGNDVDFNSIIKRHRGKTILIEVWASWCSDCVKAMPLLKDTQSKNPDVDYVFISMDKTADAWKKGIEKHALTGEHYWTPDGMKGAFGKSVDLDWIPRYIIIDATGKVIMYRAIEKDFEKINTILKQQTPKK